MKSRVRKLLRITDISICKKKFNLGKMGLYKGIGKMEEEGSIGFTINCQNDPNYAKLKVW